MKKEFGIYVHIPFCRQKCFYCDFPSFAGRERLMEGYLKALEQEFVLIRRKLFKAGEKLSPRTLYIGGGTPTSLSEALMEELFAILRRHIDISGVREFTLELNPGTVDKNKLQIIKDGGVNRLSIGVQSLDDVCLKAIGRLHTAQEAVEVVSEVRALGFDNISIDLMYGLPQQDMVSLKKTVEKAVTLSVQHISIYGLQLEEGTVFAKMEEQGRLNLPDDDICEEMYDYMTAKLPDAGYMRYEISNFALDKAHVSRHNLSYWQDLPYLGFGSGAHGYWAGKRYENLVNIEAYIEEIKQGKCMAHLEEDVDSKAHMEEFCFLGLRTIYGINKKRFRETFGCDIREVYGDVIAGLLAEGLLAENEAEIHLTEQGMKFGNKVFAEFLI